MRCCRDLLMHSFRDSFKNSYRNSFRRSIQNFSRSSFWFFFAGIHSKNHADVSFDINSVASSGVLFEMSLGIPFRGLLWFPQGLFLRYFQEFYAGFSVPSRVFFQAFLYECPPWNPAVFSVEIIPGVPYSTIALDIPPCFSGFFQKFIPEFL